MKIVYATGEYVGCGCPQYKENEWICDICGPRDIYVSFSCPYKGCDRGVDGIVDCGCRVYNVQCDICKKHYLVDISIKK